ncbi:MAG TPA: GAP family protein [Acidimicrobiales bacterium]|nr:GAP family protein [Acidimicrobiales bacterium]
MGEAIGEVLPLGVGVALSPLPIIAVVLMLVSARARTNGPAFVLGWLLGLAIVGAIVFVLAGPADSAEGGDPPTWASVVQLVLGAALLLLALRQFRGRPREGDEQPMPAWMGALDGFGPGKALGAGALLSGLNPKNLLLAVSAAATIAQTGIPGGEQAIAYGVFALLGTVGVAAPVVVFLVKGDAAKAVLARLEAWMGHNNAVIMAVLCLVIGAKLVGQAVSGLAG